MKVETLTNIIQGELLNSPFISEVVGFTNNVNKVSRGSCFFAENIEDIPKAIEKGAYAIVVKEIVDISDREIAWIKVDDFYKAVINIFKLENLKDKVYVADKITLNIVRKMSLEKEVVVLEDIEDFFKAINLKNKFILAEKNRFSFTNSVELLPKNIKLEKVGLFKSIYNNQTINLPFVYKDFFAKALHFFESNNLKYTLEFRLDRFRPIFVDNLFREVDFGESERVLIVGIKNDEIFFDELNFFIENTKHAKSIVVDKQEKLKDFNFAMCVGFIPVLKVEDEKRLF